MKTVLCAIGTFEKNKKKSKRACTTKHISNEKWNGIQTLAHIPKTKHKIFWLEIPIARFYWKEWEKSDEFDGGTGKIRYKLN